MKNLWIMVLGVAKIVDGLIAILSLGFVAGYFAPRVTFMWARLQSGLPICPTKTLDCSDHTLRLDLGFDD